MSASRPAPTSTEKSIAAAMDPIADILGGEHPVFFRPCLARIAGSLTAGVLLSQFWYWSNNRSAVDRDGWFYKTMKEIEGETTMTRTEQETARKRLRERGVLEEDKRGLPMKIWFRVNKARLAQLLGDYAATNLAGFPQDGVQAPDNQSCRIPATLDAGSLQDIDEAVKTADNTAVKTAAPSRMRDAEAPRKPVEKLSAAPEPPAAAVSDLVEELTAHGVNRSEAQRLASEHPEECRRQLDFLPFVSEFRSSRGAYLASAIKDGYGPPPSWEEHLVEQAKREQSDRAATARAAKAQSEKQQQQTREAQIAAVRAELEADPERWAQVLDQAEKRLPAPLRGKPGMVAYRPALEAKIGEIILQQMQG